MQITEPQETATRSESLSETAYRRILENLFERRLPAGAFVSQNQLVALCEVPVAPLRDALRVLQAEGVLKIHARAGIEFVKPGLELTKSTYQFRSILECAAVRVFAEAADDQRIEEIIGAHEALLDQLKSEGLSAPVLEELDRLESLLHGAIIGELENPLIESSYKRIHNYLKLLRLDRRLTVPLAQRSIREHLDILYACRGRNPDDAEAALKAHFTAALQRHMGMY